MCVCLGWGGGRGGGLKCGVEGRGRGQKGGINCKKDSCKRNISNINYGTESQSTKKIHQNYSLICP